MLAAAREGYTAPRAPLDTGDGRSIGTVVDDIMGNLSTLMRQEVALAKAEVRESVNRAARGIGLLIGAGVAALLVLVFISIGVWWGLGLVIGNQWSALLVAASWALIGLVLIAVGRRELRHIRGVPQTTETLSEIPNALRGHEEENR